MTQQRKHKKSKKQLQRERMTLVIGVVAAVFLIIFGAGALWGHSRGANANAEQLAQAIQPLGKAAQMTYTYTQTDRQENRNEFYGWSEANNQKNFTILYEGQMQIYSDTSKLSKDSIKIDKKIVTVTLPKVEVKAHEIKQESISAFDSEDKRFRPIELGNFEQFCADYKPKDVEKAAAQITQAQQNLENVIAAVVKSLGKYEVKFTYI